MVTRSSILAWRIPGKKSLLGYEVVKNQTWLSTAQHTVRAKSAARHGSPDATTQASDNTALCAALCSAATFLKPFIQY